MNDDTRRQGDIYFAALPNRDPNATHDHRIIVVSRDELNHGNDLIVVPLTSRNLDRYRAAAWAVPFGPEDSEGITKICVARCDLVVAIDTDLTIDWDQGCLGCVNDSAIEALADAIYSAVAHPSQL